LLKSNALLINRSLCCSRLVIHVNETIIPMSLAAALIYWVIIALWLAVLATVGIAFVRNPRTFGAIRLLLSVLTIDTFRNIAENLYFGLYFGGQYGLFLDGADPSRIECSFLGRALRAGVADRIQHIANSGGRLVRKDAGRRVLPSTRKARSRAWGSLRSVIQPCSSHSRIAANGSNSVKRACEEANRPFVSRVRNDPKACATSSGIVII
jgi:hypothetical protein